MVNFPGTGALSAHKHT